jgi:ribonucleoside-diphosphate reductase beta chain
MASSQQRLSILPVEDSEAWKFYKTHQSTFWTAEEISFSEDRVVFENLPEKEQKIILKILAFFSFADTMINLNISRHFANYPENSLEVNAFYGFQTMMENIHAETYALQILELVKDAEERDLLFNSVQKYPNVRMKIDWINKWIEAENVQHRHRLLAFTLIEGIFFSCSFSTIFWFKKSGTLLNGLIHSNELIARDENLHQFFGAFLFNRYNNVEKLTAEEVHDIVSEAVEIEKQFARDVLEESLPGLTFELMEQYIKFLANNILKSIHYTALYDIGKNANPFDFMDVQFELQTKTNFFEKKESGYQRSFGAGYLNDIDFSGL